MAGGEDDLPEAYGSRRGTHGRRHNDVSGQLGGIAILPVWGPRRFRYKLQLAKQGLIKEVMQAPACGDTLAPLK